MGQVVSQSELISRRGEWKRIGKGVVCASGCFDLLHPGHIRLLEHSRSLGDILIVAIESDATVRARFASANGSPENGHPRPITPASERSEILAALAAVDYVVDLESSSPLDFMAVLLPEIVAIGGSPGSDQFLYGETSDLEALGCKVLRIPLEPGYSTSRLIDRIVEFRI